MADSTLEGKRNWTNFLAKTMDYIADDSIYVKNLRILFGLVINCFGMLRDDTFKMLKDAVEIILNTSYNLDNSDADHIEVSDVIYGYFQNEANEVKNRKQWVVENGFTTDTTGYIKNNF
jgi:hypothetical protein